MTVHCPHCSTGYLLPDSLVGPRGARVRCPQCAHAFVVLEGEVSGYANGRVAGATSPAPRRTHDESPAARPGGLDRAVANRVLEELAQRIGAPFEQAVREGRILSRYGPDLLAAFDEYRRLVGPEAAAEPFVELLRERWGLVLAAPAPGLHENQERSAAGG
jgi:predicted Zn finger-like uncharacterized protein